jgi:hypothetical protein
MSAEYIGLLGTALGAAIAAAVNFLLSRQNVKSEDRQWMRNARQIAYKEFLSAGTSYHRACEQVAESTKPDKVSLLAKPMVDFDEAYIVLQIVSDKPVFLAARKYGHLLLVFKKYALAGDSAEVKKEDGKKLRGARHAFLTAVRLELGLEVDEELLPGSQQLS